jgi:hypothetical protein
MNEVEKQFNIWLSDNMGAKLEDIISRGGYASGITYNPYLDKHDDFFDIQDQFKQTNPELPHSTIDWMIETLFNRFVENMGLDPDKDREDFLHLNSIITFYNIEPKNWNNISKNYL